MRNDYEYLLGEAERLIRACRMTAPDGTPMYTPVAAGPFYRSMYLRDFEYMVEGHPRAFPPEEIKRVYLCFVRRQRDDGVIPFTIRADGSPVFLTHGGAPCTDDEQFLVKLCWEYHALTGDLSLFAETSSALVRGLGSLPRHPDSGLIWVDPERPHSAYGFTDSIAKTGELLFSSLLYWEAAGKLAELYRMAEDRQAAEKWQGEAERIKQSLQVFWRDDEGLFRAATIDCNQPDIWGSAYAVTCGVATPEQADAISAFFAANYDALVTRGQVRHLIGGTFWQRVNKTEKAETVQPGHFQNGAYWGTPVGWVSHVLKRCRPDLARRIYREMIADYRANGIYECINDGYARCKDYVVSAVLPLKDFGSDGNT